ncbi:hypothetical protein ACFL21_00135 [Patescibacteria group bacterium]
MNIHPQQYQQIDSVNLSNIFSDETRRRLTKESDQNARELSIRNLMRIEGVLSNAGFEESLNGNGIKIIGDEEEGITQQQIFEAIARIIDFTQEEEKNFLQEFTLSETDGFTHPFCSTEIEEEIRIYCFGEGIPTEIRGKQATITISRDIRMHIYFILFPEGVKIYSSFKRNKKSGSGRLVHFIVDDQGSGFDLEEIERFYNGIEEDDNPISENQNRRRYIQLSPKEKQKRRRKSNLARKARRINRRK